MVVTWQPNFSAMRHSTTPEAVTNAPRHAVHPNDAIADAIRPSGRAPARVVGAIPALILDVLGGGAWQQVRGVATRRRAAFEVPNVRLLDVTTKLQRFRHPMRLPFEEPTVSIGMMNRSFPGPTIIGSSAIYT